MMSSRSTSMLSGLLFLVCAQAVTAAEIELPSADGMLLLQFDEALIPTQQLTRYLAVHPDAYDAGYHVAPSLRLCIDGDPAYRDCGSRDLDAPQFFANAAHNIAIGKRRIQFLSTLDEFPELQGLVDYFRDSLEFGVWKNERLLEYYLSWDVGALEREYRNLPFREPVFDILAALRASDDRDRRWSLSFYEWSNTVNLLYREQEGEIPRAGWEHFKSRYNIVERLEVDQIH